MDEDEAHADLGSLEDDDDERLEDEYGDDDLGKYEDGQHAPADEEEGEDEEDMFSTKQGASQVDWNGLQVVPSGTLVMCKYYILPVVVA